MEINVESLIFNAVGYKVNDRLHLKSVSVYLIVFAYSVQSHHLVTHLTDPNTCSSHHPTPLCQRGPPHRVQRRFNQTMWNYNVYSFDNFFRKTGQ